MGRREVSLGPQFRCRDCGQWTGNLLCLPCTKVARSLGLTMQERIEMLEAADE